MKDKVSRRPWRLGLKPSSKLWRNYNKVGGDGGPIIKTEAVGVKITLRSRREDL